MCSSCCATAGRSTPRRRLRRREDLDELRRRDDGARDARVVEAPAVLLHLPVDRRRIDRRDPVGDPERARGVRRRSAVADRPPTPSSRAIKPSPDELAQKIDERLQSAGATSIRSLEMATMVRPADKAGRARMVELRAVDQGFPHYGALKIEGRPFDHALLRDFGVLARPELLAQLGLAVGDGLMIGHAPLHDSRRDRGRAGPPARRLQPRPARVRRPAGSAEDRFAGLRQPRQPSASAQGAGRGDRSARERHCAMTSGTRTRGSARTRPPRRTSARTSPEPRTI